MSNFRAAILMFRRAKITLASIHAKDISSVRPRVLPRSPRPSLQSVYLHSTLRWRSSPRRPFIAKFETSKSHSHTLKIRILGCLDKLSKAQNTDKASLLNSRVYCCLLGAGSTAYGKQEKASTTATQLRHVDKRAPKTMMCSG